MDDPIYAAHGLSKAFGPVRALADVSVSFRAGEVHAVLGENGAGKSTLMNVLAGFLRPDAGRLEWRGEPVAFASPAQARARGVAMVHQHFMLVPEFTVAENLALDRLDRLARPLDVSGLAARAVATARELGWTIAPDARAGDLPVGVQQRVEILKALAAEAEVLILDEPTAVLGPDEVEDLFRVLRALAGRGKAVVLIAHKLSEVAAIADRVTVLRRGRWVASAAMAAVDARQLAEWMVGDVPPERAFAPADVGGILLRAETLAVRGDRGEPAVRGVTFDLRRGEIFGFGGVDGNGQVELAEVLAGVRTPESGRLEWDGGAPPRRAYIPQDRHQDGLALGMSILDNLLIDGHREPDLSRGPFLRPRAARRWAEGLVERFGIRLGALDDPVSSLSGGNQQKVVVSRALASGPELLVVVNPTRGLDLRAADTVHECLREAAAAGVAIALFSTDEDELAALAHRRKYLDRGVLRADLAEALVGGPA